MLPLVKPNKKFVILCPSCRSRNRVVKKCVGRCGVRVCSQCNIDGLCHDCYLKRHRDAEMGIYFEDKFADSRCRVLSDDEYIDFISGRQNFL